MGGGRKAEEGFNLSLFSRPPFSPSVIFHYFYFLRMSEILLMFLLLDRLRFIFSTSPLPIELATNGRLSKICHNLFLQSSLHAK